MAESRFHKVLSPQSFPHIPFHINLFPQSHKVLSLYNFPQSPFKQPLITEFFPRSPFHIVISSPLSRPLHPSSPTICPLFPLVLLFPLSSPPSPSICPLQSPSPHICSLQSLYSSYMSSLVLIVLIYVLSSPPCPFICPLFLLVLPFVLYSS